MAILVGIWSPKDAPSRTYSPLTAWRNLKGQARPAIDTVAVLKAVDGGVVVDPLLSGGKAKARFHLDEAGEEEIRVGGLNKLERMIPNDEKE